MFTKRNQKGFTLMEMLIVVAIIAILVAVSIPVFTSQLDKAKTATDAANLRSAKAVAVASYLAEDESGTYLFDAAAGKILLSSGNPSIKGYGAVTANKDKIIQVVISTEGEVAPTWVAETDAT